MNQTEEEPLVVIRSLVYNHEPYLRDCLEGFVMQQTTFPFVAVVHDDCSTDGSAAIIREYAEKYPHIIKPVYETENQYSKHNGSLRRAMDEACGKYGAKYYAQCEGDDYWTDPRKLQKQVDYLETHPDCTMVCTNGEVVTPRKGGANGEGCERINWPHFDETRDLTTHEVIMQQGVMLLTASMVYRAGITDDYPEACRKCHTGDATLQTMAAMKGKIHYFHDPMVVYRFQTAGSWSSRNTQSELKESDIPRWLSSLKMYESLDEYSHWEHTKSFMLSERKLVCWLLATYSKSRKPLLRAMGAYLTYGRLKDCMPRPSGLFGRLVFLIKRVSFHPYYPDGELPGLLLPVLRPFYTLAGPRRTIHIGPVGILSFVRQEGGRDAVFVLGKRIH